MKKRFELPISEDYLWVESYIGKPVSELGKVVATILCRGFRTGIYNIDGVRKADWTDERRIEIRTGSHRLSTYDFDALTHLVIACHEACVRLEINPCNPQLLKLTFHPRDGRVGGFAGRHPSIDEAVAAFREVSAKRSEVTADA